MVTRKTRVLSAIAVVLMLVSLFTCFVLPAGAETPTSYADLPAGPVAWPEVDLVPYADRTSDTDALVTDDEGILHYAITCADDWLAAVADTKTMKSTTYEGTSYKHTASEETFDDVVLWFTNDIDFSEVTALTDDSLSNTEKQSLIMAGYFKMSEEVRLRNASGATRDNGFRGTIHGQGFAIKNFDLKVTYNLANGNYKSFGFIATARGATIRDLTIDASSSFDVTCDGTASTPLIGAFVGEAYNTTFINCRNDASVTYTAGTCTKDAYVTAFGYQYLSASYTNSSNYYNEDLYGANKIINCINTGALTNNYTSGDTAVFGSTLLANPLEIYNSFNTGVLTAKSSSAETDNTGLISPYRATASVTAANLYSVGDNVAAGAYADGFEEKGTTLETGAEATGELAFLLNQNWNNTYDTDYGHKYFTVADGKTAWGTEANQAIRVQAVDADGYEIGAAYPNADNAVVTLGDLHNIPSPKYTVETGEDATVTDGVLTVNAFPATGLTVTVTVTTEETVEVDTSALEAWLDEHENAAKNPDYYTVDGTETGYSLTDLYGDVRQKIDEGAYISEGGVNAELEALNAALENYKMWKILPISEWETYGSDAPGFEVASVEDLEILASSEIKAALSADDVIYITTDITFEDGYDGAAKNLGSVAATIDGSRAEGGVATISNLTFATNWIGTEDKNAASVSGLKNLVFKNFTATAVPTNGGMIIGTLSTDCVIENVTLDSCQMTVSTNMQVNTGMLVGRADGGKLLTLRDITVKDCVMDRNDYDPEVATSEYANSALVVGKTLNVTVDADGIYVVGNTIKGDRHGNGAGIVFGEVVDPITVKNVLIEGTTIEKLDSTKEHNAGQTNVDGALIGYLQKATVTSVTVENVISVNNGDEAVWLVRNTSSIAKNAVAKNVYTVEKNAVGTNNGHWTLENVNANAADVIASGEAAYVLNTVGGTKKLAMDGATPILDTEDTAEPVEIIFEMTVDGDAYKTYKKYTDKTGKLIVDDAFKALATWDVTDWDAAHTETVTYTGAHAHAWDEGVIDPDSTCTEEGVKTYTCTTCGGTKTEGVSMKEHAWNEGEVTTAPTCTEAGEKTYTCGTCGETKTEKIEATGHNMQETTPANPASCTTAGTTAIYTCANNCGHTEGGEEIAVLPHTPGEWKTTVEPSCEMTGTKEQRCTVCDEFIDAQIIDPLGHTEETVAGKDATCTEPGLTEGKVCSVCGTTTVMQEEIPMLPHIEGEWVTTTEPNCTETGSKTLHCAVCYMPLNFEEIPALGHNYEGGRIEYIGDDKHWTLCVVCETSVDAKTEDCVFGEWSVREEATEFTDGLEERWCLFCANYQTRVIPATDHTHTYDDGVVTTPATCTEDGVMTFTCSGECVDGHTYTETIPATGHTEETVAGKAATCTETGLTEGKVCTVCGETTVAQEEIPALGHNYEANEDGKLICTGCGEAAASNGGLTLVDGVYYLFNADGTLVNGVFADWGAYKALFIVNGRPSGAGVFEYEGAKVYITSSHQLANDQWYVTADQATELGGKAGANYYCFSGGKLVSNTFGEWGTYGNLFMMNGRPSGAGVFEYNNATVYITSSHQLAEGKRYINADQATELGGKVGANYYGFKSGELANGAFVDWGTPYGTLFMANGRPSGAGVFEYEGAKVYITSSHQLANGQRYVTADQATELGGKAGANYYCFNGGKLVSNTFGEWGTYGNLFMMNGRPSGAGVFEYNGATVYITSSHQLADGRYYLTAEKAEALNTTVGYHNFVDGVLAD